MSLWDNSKGTLFFLRDETLLNACVLSLDSHMMRFLRVVFLIYVNQKTNECFYIPSNAAMSCLSLYGKRLYVYCRIQKLAGLRTLLGQFLERKKNTLTLLPKRAQKYP